MDALTNRVTHTENRSLQVRAGTEVRDGTKELGAMELEMTQSSHRHLLLHRVAVLVTASEDRVRIHSQLHSILVLFGSSLLQNSL